MRVAIVSPESVHIQHRVRGTGYYFENLRRALEKISKESFIFCSKDEIPTDVDLIHYPYFEPFFLTLSIFKKTKRVVTVHDLTPLVFPEHFPKGLKGGIKWIVQRLALRNSDATITDSSSSKKDIMKFAGISEAKIHVVYLAASDIFKQIKEPSILSSIESKYKLPEKFALYVGDVTWNKNLPRLVEAVKKVNIPLVMVGKALVEKKFDINNPWNKDLLRVIELSENDERIIRVGFVPDSDLVMLYNFATIFVMPSLYEGFGLPILEAMSCGCPVVTTKEGSIPEVAGNAAFYVDAYNVKSIADGISEVFENEKLRVELSKKGLAQSKKFSWEKTALETIKVYEKTLT